ncbi:MAG: restriction endonuclease, partial [Terracidiphilus sp.]
MKIQAEQRTDLWKSDLDWPDYETYVFGTLQRLMPGDKIMQNVAMKGTLSGRSRQIDIVVDRLYEGTSMRVAVDCKCYKRKVNIKDVEAFLGMLEDLGIRKGALVTTKGYSKSAYNRAQNGSGQTELRIISPERLSDFQHMGDAYAWVETVAAIVSPPQGWVVDNEDTRPERMQFSMYPLGHTRDSAMHRGAFIYGNIILKREANASIESIARAHEIDAIKNYPNARFKWLESPRLSTDATANPVKTLLRLGYPDESESWPEFSLYIDHPKAVLVLVLQCPLGEDDRYLPSLIRVGEKAIMTGIVDQRLERTRAINGRIAVYWNKAKYVEVTAVRVKWRFGLFSGYGVHIEPAAVEVDGVDEVLSVAKSTCGVLHP